MTTYTRNDSPADPQLLMRAKAQLEAADEAARMAGQRLATLRHDLQIAKRAYDEAAAQIRLDGYCSDEKRTEAQRKAETDARCARELRTRLATIDDIEFNLTLAQADSDVALRQRGTLLALLGYASNWMRLEAAQLSGEYK